MELVYAALLLHSADQDITEDNVSGVLEGAGLDVDASQVKALVAALEDVDLDEAMTTAVAAPAAAAPAEDGASAETEADEAEEEAEEADEEAEEDAAEGLGSLF